MFCIFHFNDRYFVVESWYNWCIPGEKTKGTYSLAFLVSHKTNWDLNILSLFKKICHLNQPNTWKPYNFTFHSRLDLNLNYLGRMDFFGNLLLKLRVSLEHHIRSAPLTHYFIDHEVKQLSPSVQHILFLLLQGS